MNKFLTFIFIIVSIFSFANFSFAKENEVKAYLFYGDGCPHCAKEEAFLDSIKDKYPTLEVKTFEIYYSRSNIALMKEVSNKLKANASGVPFLIIGEKYFIGYAEGVTSVEIEAEIKHALSNAVSDIVGDIIKDKEGEKNQPKDKDLAEGGLQEEDKTEGKEKLLKLPFLGTVNVYKVSLPILAIAMGTLDGFNPCAMWVLIFLISMLIGMGDRRRMWIIGTTFIVASALVYFIFMSAWLNLIIFLGFVAVIRIIIGLLALAGGGYNIKEFFTKKDNTCEVTNENQKEKIVDRLKRITKEKNLLWAVGGIIVLAFMVNLVELVCSAGLPAIFTQVLVLNDISSASYYGYILLYILFFMIDDLIIFIIAMTTLRVTGITTKYSRYSHLIGGIIMVIIGLLLIFKPEVLMFG